jgi:hypothetical protein
MTMRPRKNLLTLSLDGMRAFMASGKPYSVQRLAYIFDASKTAIADVLVTLEAQGSVTSSHANCGMKRDLRSERRIYWAPVYSLPDVAARRLRSAETPGELSGYDLSRFQRLAMETRR